VVCGHFLSTIHVEYEKWNQLLQKMIEKQRHKTNRKFIELSDKDILYRYILYLHSLVHSVCMYILYVCTFCMYVHSVCMYILYVCTFCMYVHSVCMYILYVHSVQVNNLEQLGKFIQAMKTYIIAQLLTSCSALSSIYTKHSFCVVCTVSYCVVRQHLTQLGFILIRSDAVVWHSATWISISLMAT
jgi:hypothetical protein